MIDHQKQQTLLLWNVNFFSILNWMEKGYQVDAIYTDYSKAFDKVSHKLLITRFAEIGMGCNLLKWLTSYLSERKVFQSIQS